MVPSVAAASVELRDLYFIVRVMGPVLDRVVLRHMCVAAHCPCPVRLGPSEGDSSYRSHAQARNRKLQQILLAKEASLREFWALLHECLR